eukprot:TRINITY_DN1973_c0_g1_i1.p1 TRINITY_DN1973_c0_g1~~TRINITY_DN1973_c0_g1_i1.p1  ORF type:complete len:580 (+),score=123.72 TRINITY_DN1973_c0_g1_i1:44-1741(+)
MMEEEPDEVTQRLSLLELEEEDGRRIDVHFSYQDEGKPTDETVWGLHREIKDLLWNSKVDQAEAMIEPFKDKSLVYAILHTEIAFWRFNFDQNEDTLKEVEERLVVIENMAHFLSEKYKTDHGLINSWLGGVKDCGVDEETQYALYIEATIASAFVQLGFSMINFRNQNMVKGAYYMHRSWKKFNYAQTLVDTQEKKGYHTDQKTLGIIKFCRGIFHFGASMIPPRFQWLGKIIGIEGDREQALEELQFAVDVESTVSIEAKMVLIGLKKFFFEQEEEALSMLSDLMSQYPESAVMWYMHGFFNRGMGNINQAIKSFHRCHEYGGDIGHLRLTANYHLGYTYFLKNDWEKCAENFKAFLDGAEVNRFKPYSAYVLGFCYWQLGQRELIDEYYSRINEWVRPNQSYDEFAERKVQDYYDNNGYTPFDEIYISASALHEGKFEKKALRKIEELIPLLKADPDNRDNYTLYYHLKGSILRGLGKSDRAVDMFKRAAQAKDQISNRYLYSVAYSLCELAEIELESNNLDQADRYLKEAKSLKNYDWERLVSYKISTNQQRVTRRKKETR